MITPSRQSDQVPRFCFYTNPTILNCYGPLRMTLIQAYRFVPNIEVATAIDYIADFVIIMQMFIEEVFNLLFVIRQQFWRDSDLIAESMGFKHQQ